MVCSSLQFATEANLLSYNHGTFRYVSTASQDREMGNWTDRVSKNLLRKTLIYNSN